MLPFERFKKMNTEGNLWIFILSLGKEELIQTENIRRLIFEKFDFLPGIILTERVLYRLRSYGFVKSEKYKGKRAYKTTEKGKAELGKMKVFSQELLQKL